MPPLTLSSLTTEYVKVPVRGTRGGAPTVLSGTTVEMAFTARDAEPIEGDWNDGSWEVLGDGYYYARCLVGPGAGGTVLAAGVWQPWVKVTDVAGPPVVGPEAPILKALDLLVIT